MILYNENGFKIVATKTKMPKLMSGDWDFVRIKIDGKETDFHCSNKANRSNFYFKYQNEWFKVPIVDDKIGDLYNDRPDLFVRVR